LTTTVAGTLPPGKAGVDAVQRLEDRRAAARHAVGARILELHVQRGDRHGDEQAAGDDDRHEGALEDAGQDRVPEARLAVVLWRRLAM